MTLYYYRMEGRNTALFVSASRKRLEEERKKAKEKMKGGNVSLGEIKETAHNWEVFSSVSPIMYDYQDIDSDGETLYGYTLEDGQDSTFTVSSNRDTIEDLHHDDMIPVSESEKQSMEVEDIKEVGVLVGIRSDSYIE